MPDFSSAISDAEGKFNLPTGLLGALIHVESGGNPNAVSDQGAEGLTQIMPGTARALHVDTRDPNQAIYGAAHLLRENMHATGNDLEAALMMYHGGPNTHIWGPKTTAYARKVLDAMKTPQPQARSADEFLSQYAPQPQPQPHEQAQSADAFLARYAPHPAVAAAKARKPDPVDRIAHDTYGGFGAQVGKGMLLNYGPTLSRAIFGKTGKRVADAEEKEEQGYEQRHPILSGIGQTIGAAANPLFAGAGRLLSGIPLTGRVLAGAGAGAYEAHEHGAGIGGDIAGAAAGAAGSRYVPSALAGAGGAAALASGAAKPGHRLEAAQDALLPGALLGGALHAGGEVAGELAGAIDARTGYTGSKLLDRAKTWWTGKKPDLSPVERRAAERLREPARQDRLPETVAEKQAARAAAGIKPANVTEAGGRNLTRAVKVAARRPGEQTNAAQKAYDTQYRNLSTEMTGHLRELHPSTEGTDVRLKNLEEARDREARTTFREPYSKPVELDERMMKLLANREMRAPLQTAERTAQARSATDEDPEAANQAREIAKIHNYSHEMEQFEKEHETWEKERTDHEKRVADWEASGGYDPDGLDRHARELFDGAQSPTAKERVAKALGMTKTPRPEIPPEPQRPVPPTVSAGTLDRVRIGVGDIARNEAVNGSRGLASGLGKIHNAIDSHLDQVEDLKPARDAYREKSERMETLQSKANPLKDDPADYAAYLKRLKPHQLDEEKLRVRNELMERGGGDASDAQSLIKDLTTGSHGRTNLARLFGEEQTNKLEAAAGFMRDDLKTAQMVAGVGESRTAENQQDEAAMRHVMQSVHNPMGAVRHALEDLVSKRALTEEEAHAMYELSRGDPARLLKYFRENPKSPFTATVRTALASEGGSWLIGPDDDDETYVP